MRRPKFTFPQFLLKITKTASDLAANDDPQRNSGHAEGAKGKASEHDVPPAEAVDSQNGNNGSEEVDSGQRQGCPELHLLVVVIVKACLLHDFWAVIHGGVDAAELLPNLKHDSKEDDFAINRPELFKLVGKRHVQIFGRQ